MKPRSAFLSIVVVFSICLAVSAAAYQIEPKATRSARLIMKFENWKARFTGRMEPTGGNYKDAPDFLELGRITNFHSYGKQHTEKDIRDALEIHLASAQPNVVDVGKTLLDFYKEGKTWGEGFNDSRSCSVAETRRPQGNLRHRLQDRARSAETGEYHI